MTIENPVKKDIRDFKRFEKILTILFEEGFGFLLDKLDLKQHVPLAKRVSEPRKKKPGPERVRETFERLGTTFIKFGQIISERPDVIPEEYCKELEKLEDSVPSFDSEKAKEIVDREVGIENFEEFSDEPIAAASIAQVHEARLENGDRVAVKVRRPGIKEQMEKDLDIIQYLGKKIDKHVDLGNQMVYKEVKEFSDWTRSELNLRMEGKNAQRFKENISDEERAVVPDIYMEHTTEEVLVMEFIDAIKCDDREKLKELDIDQKEIADTGMRSFLKQLLRDGFIHVDPHPSNFMVNEEGNLVYLDFGMMADITKEMQKNIGLMILQTYDEDVEGLLETMQDMAYMEDDVDIEKLKAEVEKMVMSLRGASLQDQSISKVLVRMARKSAESGLYLPTKFLLIGKGLVTMEGIGLKIYPEFEFSDEYQNLVKKLVVKNSANPKDMTRSFFIDLMQNQDLITKLPSKINDQLESEESQKIVDNTPESSQNIVPAAVILGSLYLLGTSANPDSRLIIGVGGILLAGYYLRKNN